MCAATRRCTCRAVPLRPQLLLLHMSMHALQLVPALLWSADPRPFALAGFTSLPVLYGNVL